MAGEWKRGFGSVAWRRYNADGSARPNSETKTHLRHPLAKAATLCGSAIPEGPTGDTGAGPCVRCAVQAALLGEHAPALRSHKTGGGWGSNWGRVWRPNCACGHAPGTNLGKREAEAAHRRHVVAVVKAELGVA